MRKTLVIALLLCLMLSVPGVASDDRDIGPAQGSVWHRVLESDTFDSIAQVYGVSVSELKAANGIDSLFEKDTLSVPPSSKGWPVHRVRPGETLWRIGKAYGISVEQLRQANRLHEDRILPGNTLLLPRARKPEWNLPELVPAPNVDTLSLGDASVGVVPQQATSSPATNLSAWVEVRLPDNRRAWVKAEDLVLGSWEPLGRDELIETARRFIGVPYSWGGTDPNGYDCSGFVQEVFRLAGHSVPRMADSQFENLDKVSKEELAPGDLVFFNTDGSGISHVGIFSGEGQFLHASSSRGVIESHLDESYYSARFIGAARISDWSTEVSLQESAPHSRQKKEPSSRIGDN